MKNLTRKALKPFFYNFFTGRLTAKINLWNNSIFQKLMNVSLSDDCTHYVDIIDNITVEYVPNTSVGNSLFFDSDFEKKEIKFFIDHSLNHKFPVILDIGANIGWHSIRWASQRKDAIVYAFEPSPSVIPILHRNVHKNRLEERIRIIEKAVSNVKGNANFFECDDNAYSSLKNTQRKAIDISKNWKA